MKSKIISLIALSLSLILLFGCANEEMPSDSENNLEQTEISSLNSTDNSFDINTAYSENTETNLSLENESAKEDIMYIKIGQSILTAELADNSSAKALYELLQNGDITINVHDYAGFEKVGDLGTDLPQNNEQINTQPGDLILYQGNQFVLYYGYNSWSLTRLGKVLNVTEEKLKEILGEGDVVITLSLSE